MGDILQAPDGEEIYYGDLLVGIDTLPPRQRQAFELICLEGYTETAATKIMLPDSKWSTPVQQYADAALARMVAAYDEKQAGTWDPNALPAKKAVAPRQKVTIFMSDMSDVLQKHLKNAYDELIAVRDRIGKEIDRVEALLKGKES